jgi:hypothetical protein
MDRKRERHEFAKLKKRSKEKREVEPDMSV